MKRRNMGIAAAALLIAAAAAWYLGSPWWTLWRMREAARAGDVGAVAVYIDRPALAARAKARAKAELRSILAEGLADTASSRRLVALARRRLAELDREAALDPAALLGWLAQIPIAPGSRRSYDPVVTRHGLDRFEVRDRGASVENGPLLGFRRHGLSWKLEEVRWGQQ